MRAISLWQPWATLVAIEAKQFETRHWKTPFRGELAIHASGNFRRDCRELAQTDLFFDALKRGCLKDSGLTEEEEAAIPFEEILLPLAGIVCVVELTGIMTTNQFITASCNRTAGSKEYARYKQEVAFGDYGPGRYAWRLENIRKLANPVACKGRQSFWTLPPDIETQVRAELN